VNDDTSGQDLRRALVLVHEPGNSPGVVGRALAARGWALTEHLIVEDLERPAVAAPFPSLAGFDMLVAMGSVQSVYDTETIGPWIAQELDLIRRAHQAALPVLGICFGGQALAAALGGRVERSPWVEIGWCEVEGPDNPIGPGPWFEWHQDRFEVPVGAQTLARTEVGPQLFRCGRSVGTQFHPEVDLAKVAGWLDECPDEYLVDIGADRQQLLAVTAELEAANVANCHRLIDWFLDEVAVSDPG
jgi:GMP synthase-like glutamine amidotransferase